MTQADTSTNRFTGRHVVIAMLAFSVLIVSAMDAEGELYTRPFRPLQDAIALEFPESGPRVIGGRHKSHEPGTPATLRIIVQVDFDPNANEPQALATARQLARLASANVDLSDYDELNVHLEQRIAEKELRRWEITRSIEDWETGSVVEVTPAATTGS